MGLLRIILVVIALIIIYRMVRHFLAKTRDQARKPGAGPEGSPTDIVPCAVCGVHVPRETAIHKNDRYYCCQEHARQQ